MSWATFGKAVLLIVIFAFVTTAFKCIHDIKCTACKTPPSGAAAP